MKTNLIILCLLLAVMIPGISRAQDEEPPPVSDSLQSYFDLLKTADSLKAVSVPEVRPVKEKKSYKALSVSDSISSYLLDPRLNLENNAHNSFQQDAGDFLRADPGAFIVNYQTVPLRKTVSPFTLPGDRIDVIFNNRKISPIEHQLRPDNQTDFNEIPMAPVDEIYSLHGPAGMLYGGSNTTSSLVLVPHEPDTTRAESRMVVDKGWFGYANTSGLFTIKTDYGKSVKLSADYRRSDGEYANAGDDSYHQWGEIKYPLKNNIVLDLEGRLYKRDGGFPFWPDSTSEYMDRFRRDRDLSAGLEWLHGETQNSTLEFRHQRSEGSRRLAGRTYERKLDVYDNAFTISHQIYTGDLGLEFDLEAREERYKDMDIDDNRYGGYFSAKFLIGNQGSSVAGMAKVEQVDEYDPTVSGVLIYTRRGRLAYLSASAGYTTRFPRQYELYLSPISTAVIDATADYSESGNPDLKVERQLSGNISIGIGAVGNDFLLSITGGKIYDGIDWYGRDSVEYALGVYSPINRDIRFADITARQKFSYNDIIGWTGGASYHYIEMSNTDDPPYAPDYQAFTGLNIHIYIEHFDIHLYGYGEATYNAAYYGYDGTDMGEDVILSAKLSFRIKRFQFYYIFQNAPSVEYTSREYYTIPGRYNFYGLTWRFID